MRRILTASLFAVPLLVTSPGSASANNGPCTFGLGCGGICLNLFPRMHQHGPLYNYGPYCGYYPFTPYGPWNPYLQYEGGYAEGGKAPKVKHGNPHPLCPGGLFHGRLAGLFHKHHGACDAGAGCDTCAPSAAAATPSPTPAPAPPAPAQPTAYSGYPGYPGYGYPGYGYPGYGYPGYANPYAAAASGYYYTPYMPQPGVMPVGYAR
jgi:hypothetical protein